MSDVDFRISPTRIRSKGECDRAWYFSEVAGLRDKKHQKAKSAGTAIHRDAELYLTRRIPRPRTPEIVWLRRLGLLPARQTSRTREDRLRCELEIREFGVELAGQVLDGQIDIVDPRDGTLEVIDLKTRSRLDYCPDPEELREDEQAIIYPRAALEMVPGEFDEVSFTHLNVVREDAGGPDAKIVTVHWKAEEVKAEFQKLGHRVISMLNVAKRPIEYVDKDTDYCYKYGKCPFKGLCDHL